MWLAGFYLFLLPAAPVYLLWATLCDGWHDSWTRTVTRENFSRPSFSAHVSADGELHISGGEDPDHSERAIAFLRTHQSAAFTSPRT